MFEIHINHTPEASEIVRDLPKSLYFSEGDIAYRKQHEPRTRLLAAYIGSQVVGALTWDLSDMRLKIGFVEVHSDFRGNQIGKQMLLAVEDINQGKFHSCVGYLSDARNEASRKMFLSAGYHVFDTWKLYK